MRAESTACFEGGQPHKPGGNDQTNDSVCKRGEKQEGDGQDEVK